MAVEKGDWVRTGLGNIEGEVVEVRGENVVVVTRHFGSRLSVSKDKVRITTRPQTGLRKGGK